MSDRFFEKAGFFLPLVFFVVHLVGCNSDNRKATIESDQVEIAFAAFSGQDLEHPLCMLVLHNDSDDMCRVLDCTIICDTASSEVASDVLKITSPNLSPNAWEYVVVGVNANDLTDNMRLHIEYESRGKTYFTSQIISTSHAWCKLAFGNSDSADLFMYANIPKRLKSKPLCRVNGVEAECTSISQFETTNGTYVLAARIEPKQHFDSGDRVFVRLSFDDQTHYGGATKVFSPFVAGKTQYELVVRPVGVEYADDAIKLDLYNEADFRKSPAIINRVRVNGRDVTEQSILPEDSLPPDLGNFDKDLRKLVVHYPLGRQSEKLRFDIDFRRLPPLRSEPTPHDYFETQTASFSTQKSIPFGIGPEGSFGLEGGVCVFYGGLRPRPSLPEIVRRSAVVSDKEPAIPIIACVPHGTKHEKTRQIAACCDFMVVGQPAPFSGSTLHRSGVFFDSFRSLSNLPVPWAVSILLGEDQSTSPKDIEWITWATIGLGGEGHLVGP